MIEQAPKYLRKVQLPDPLRPECQTKTLIFDLDETLVHCAETSIDQSEQRKHSSVEASLVRLKVGNEEITAKVNMRPYVRECLAQCSSRFQIGIFTASSREYADAVIDQLVDPEGKFIQFRLYREHCYQAIQNATLNQVLEDPSLLVNQAHPTEQIVGGGPTIYVKDLRVIENRNLQDVLLVDNSTYSFGFQLANGIPIIPFYAEAEDQELVHLASYVLSLCQEGVYSDVREQNSRTFQLTELLRADLSPYIHELLVQNQQEQQAGEEFTKIESSHSSFDDYSISRTQRQQHQNNLSPGDETTMSGGAPMHFNGIRNDTICEESFEESDVVVAITSQDATTRFNNVMVQCPKKAPDNSNMSSRRYTPLGRLSSLQDSPTADEGKVRSGNFHKAQRRQQEVLVGKRLDFQWAESCGPLTPAEVHQSRQLYHQ